ncbi:MAG: hypothetical protein M5U19_01980 [Microthrixaceae bacterium]|nr:hypothetical protein [Microthrixaceae bacterium]
MAFIGAIVLAGLTGVFMSKVDQDDRISAAVQQEVGVRVSSGASFVDTDHIASAADKAGLDEATTTALVEDYEDAQIMSLKAGLLVAGLLALASLAFTRDLPRTVAAPDQDEAAVGGSQ